MSPSLFLIAIVLTTLHHHQHVYAFSVPPAPYDVLYERYYSNLPGEQIICITIADVFQSTAAFGSADPPQPFRMVQCEVTPHAERFLMPMSEAEVEKVLGSNLQMETLDSMLPNENGDLAIIFDGSSQAAPGGLWNTPVRSLLKMVGDFNKYRSSVPRTGKGLIRTVHLQQSQHGGVGMTGMGDASPLSYVSPYSSPQVWSFLRRETTPATGLISSGHQLTIVLSPSYPEYRSFSAVPSAFNAKTLAEAWSAFARTAQFNKKDWLKASSHNEKKLSVFYASETYYPMWFNENLVTVSEAERAKENNMIAPSCLTLAKPTCFPSGGLSVWGFTRRDQPSRIGLGAAALPPNIVRKSIGVFTATSSRTLFSKIVPAADGVVSGLLASLLIMMTLTETKDGMSASFVNSYLRSTLVEVPGGSGSTLLEPSQLQFLFAQGEDWGLAGSARFLMDMLSLECTAGDQQSCQMPFLKFTNYTSVDPEEFTHLIHLEQLGYQAERDLYYHFDATRSETRLPSSPTSADASFNFSSSASQRLMNERFRNVGMKEANTSQLPPNSLFSFHQFVSRKNARLALNSSSSSSSGGSLPGRLPGQLQETTMTTISGYDAQYANPYLHSIDDLPSYVNASKVIDAAQAVLDVLADIWWTEYLDFKAIVQGDPAAAQSLPLMTRANFTFEVNATIGMELWKCLTEDFNCAFLTSRYIRPFVVDFPGAPRVPNYWSGDYGLYDHNTPAQFIVSQIVRQHMMAGAPPVPNCTSCNTTAGGSGSYPYGLCLEGACYNYYSGYVRAMAPALDQVGGGPVYFNQTDLSARLPDRSGGPSSSVIVGRTGLPSRFFRNIFTESFWSEKWGTRGVMLDDGGDGVFMFVGGLVTTILTPVVFVVLRSLGNKLKRL